MSTAISSGRVSAAIQSVQVQTEYFNLAGGLNLTQPALSIASGMVIDAQNYVTAITGGYERVGGFERYDGRAKPSAASYYLLPATITGTIAVGNTITGATSGATGKVLATVTGIIILTLLTGTFNAAENITIAAVVVATTTDLAAENNENTLALHCTYRNQAADVYRALILVVPGSGRIRGVWLYSGVLYAFRDNAGGTACAMYKSTSTGWALITLPSSLSYSLGHVLPADGALLRGLTSAATATSRRAVNRTGSLGSTSVGALIVDTVVGTFSATELIVNPASATIAMTIAAPAVVTYTAHGLVAGNAVAFTTTGALPTGVTAGVVYYVISTGLTANEFQIAATVGGTAIVTSGVQSGVHTGWKAYVTASAAPTQITLAPGGRYSFITSNFSGATGTRRMYGADGVNKAFEFDGTHYVPITTGMATDTPKHIVTHKNHLFLSFGASLQHSSITNPYAWSPITGASEIALGDDVTNLVSLPGVGNAAALAVFSKSSTNVLYGTSTANWDLQSHSREAGALNYMAQALDYAYALDNAGIRQLTPSLEYGNFASNLLSNLVKPALDLVKNLGIASSIYRGGNQIRFYFSDNSGLALTVTGVGKASIMPFNYGMPVRCICSLEDTDGEEKVFFGSDDGYVYQAEVGTSFDGAAIEAWCRLAFWHSKSPRIRKRYRKAVIEAEIEEYTDISVSYDCSYGSTDFSLQPEQSQKVIGGGVYWDKFTWDKFVWDGQAVAQPSVSLAGTGTNISILFRSNSDEYLGHTLQGTILHFTPRILQR